MEILQTKDYSLFSTINGNRNLSQAKINNIVADIDQGLNLLPYCPIIVYKKGDAMHIVDGQHRFQVSKEIKSPVHYVVCQEIALKDIAKLNSRSEKWKIGDFLNCYIKLGIQDYITLKEFMTQFRVNISTAMGFLQDYSIMHRSERTEKFKNGQFQINHLEKATALMTLSHSLFDRYVFYNDRNLIEAVNRIQKKDLCDFDVLRDKIKKWPMGMEKQANPMDYVYNIERVYNYNNQHRKVIY